MSEKKDSETLLVFGGTFDPPHLGHVACVESLLRRFANAQVLIVPSPTPPVQVGIEKKVTAPYLQRLEMAKIAFSKLDRVQVSDLESALPAPNYTVHTMQHLQKLHPNRQLVLVMGLDQWHNFHSWLSASRILEIADVFVFSRKDYATNSLEIESTLKKIGHDAIQKDGQWLLNNNRKSKIHFESSFDHPEKSTNIRQGLCGLDHLPEQVAQYIKTNRLYGFK